MDRSLLYFGGIMIAGFAAIGQLRPFIPLGMEWINFVLFMGVMFGGIAALNYMFTMRTAPYPYLRTCIRPMNEIVNLFYDIPQLECRHLIGNWYNTTIKVQFPQKINDFGDVNPNTIKFVHEYSWEDRIKLRRGTACLDDFDFEHGQTDEIEVVALPGKQMSLKLGEVIPEYKIISARNDYRLNFSGSTASVFTPTMNKLGASPTCENCAKVTELTTNLSQALNDANDSHQKYVGLRQLVELKTVETAGLMDQKGGIKDFSIEYVLTLLSALGTFQKVKDYLMGSMFNRVGKWVVFGAVAAFAIFVVWQNPQWFNGVYLWASNPQNQIMMGLIVVALVVVSYWALSRRS